MEGEKLYSVESPVVILKSHNMFLCAANISWLIHLLRSQASFLLFRANAPTFLFLFFGREESRRSRMEY